MPILRCHHMNMRAEIQATYHEAFFGTGERAEAYAAAMDRFADLAGYVPEARVLDRLLQGAVLGRRHVLMQLLEGASVQGPLLLTGPATQALRIKPQS